MWLLQNVKGVKFYQPNTNGSKNNYQYVVIEVDEKEFGISRRELRKTLQAENIIARSYFRPGVHKSLPYTVILSLM